MRSIEQSLDSIATALTALAAVHAGGATNAPAPIATAAAEKPRGRPPGSTNKPKPVEAAPTTAPEAEQTDTDSDVQDVPDVTVAQKAVNDALKAGFRDEVLKALAKYGSRNASGVKADDRAAFVAELTALTDAAG